MFICFWLYTELSPKADIVGTSSSSCPPERAVRPLRYCTVNFFWAEEKLSQILPLGVGSTIPLLYNYIASASVIFLYISKAYFTNNYIFSSEQSPDLRYSVDLCDKENEFREKRTAMVFEAMKTMLGDQGPQNMDEVEYQNSDHTNLISP